MDFLYFTFNQYKLKLYATQILIYRAAYLYLKILKLFVYVILVNFVLKIAEAGSSRIVLAGGVSHV